MSSTRFTFAGHQSFHIRDGWLAKGLETVAKNPVIFLGDRPTDELGVGKNMVNAIRYWLSATGLTEEHDGKRGSETHLSKFGKVIAEFDPDFEDLHTWWFLHLNLVSNKELATSFYWFFNNFPPGNRFDARLALRLLMDWVKSSTPRKYSDQSMQKDIAVFCRMYADRGFLTRKLPPEETLESPFAKLRLLDTWENSGEWEIRIGPKQVTDFVFEYALQKYCEENPLGVTTTHSMSLRDCQEEIGSPGRTLGFDADSLYSAVEKLCASRRGYSLDRGAETERDSFAIRQLSTVAVARNYYEKAMENSELEMAGFA